MTEEHIELLKPMINNHGLIVDLSKIDIRDLIPLIETQLGIVIKIFHRQCECIVYTNEYRKDFKKNSFSISASIYVPDQFFEAIYAGLLSIPYYTFKIECYTPGRHIIDINKHVYGIVFDSDQLDMIDLTQDKLIEYLLRNYGYSTTYWNNRFKDGTIIIPEYQI